MFYYLIADKGTLIGVRWYPYTWERTCPTIDKPNGAKAKCLVFVVISLYLTTLATKLGQLLLSSKSIEEV